MNRPIREQRIQEPVAQLAEALTWQTKYEQAEAAHRARATRDQQEITKLTHLMGGMKIVIEKRVG